jgi:hypothetical protein
MNQVTTSTAIPTRALKLEALSNISASFDPSSTPSKTNAFVFRDLRIGILSLATPTLAGRSIGGSDRLGLAHGGRQGDADGLEYTADISGHRRAGDEVFAVLLHLDLLKPIEIHQQSAPLRLHAGRGEAIVQGFANNQGQERTEHMAADGRVGLVIDRPRVEDGFHGLKNIFHAQELAVAQHDGERIEGRVGAQDIEAIIMRILDDAIPAALYQSSN